MASEDEDETVPSGRPGPGTAFEDLRAGQVVDLGWTEVTEADMVAFATRFDPQPFHIDPQAAAASPFGGLIASGWHTAAVAMRLLVDGFLAGSASLGSPSLGSPGVDEVRWPAPVRPGDRLWGRMTILEARPSATKADRGVVRSRTELVNQDGTTVLSMVGVTLLGRRR